MHTSRQALRLTDNLAHRHDSSPQSPTQNGFEYTALSGEALDGGDKATAKAMSAAYKAAMVQTFCIPIAGSEDPDRTSHRLVSEPPMRGFVPSRGAGYNDVVMQLKNC